MSRLDSPSAYRRALTALLCVIACLALPAAASAGESAQSGSLTVKVSGLPANAPAAVRVSGPDGFSAELRHSRGFAGLTPGTYRIRVSRVRLDRPAKEIPAGSDAFPAKAVVSVRVRPHRHAVAAAAYGTIRSSNIVVLRRPVDAVVGSATAPTAIALSASSARGISPGTILSATPSTALPAGLFHRVVGVKRQRGKVVLALEPASLWEAFPGLDLTASVPLGAESAPASATSSDVLSAVDLSFSRDLLAKKLKASCGLSPGGWSFSPSGSLRPTLNVDIHRHYLVVPYGELSLNVKGSLGIEATVPAGLHCEFTIPLRGFQAFIVVAGVPVPVEGGVDLVVKLQNNEAIAVKATAGLEVTGGMSFDGAKAKPIFKVDPSGSGSVSGVNGAIEVGPKVQAGIGALAGNAHVDLTPRLAGEAKSPGCEILLRASAGAGFDLGSFHPSINTPSWQHALYHCPSAKSGGAAGGGGSGPGPSGSTGSWTTVSAPSPAGAQYTFLDGVSCSSPSFCMAVGSTNNPAAALTETWNGSSWTIVSAAPDPGATGDAFYDVSCASAGSCIAVGSSIQGGLTVPLVETWNGANWSIVPTPNPPAAQYSSLTGVSCVGAGWCMAVGRTDSGGSTRQLVEHWNGSGWSLQAPPSPPSSDESGFSSVACVSQAFCEAVGSYNNDQGTFTGTAFAERWDGSSWTLQSTPPPSGGVFSGLAGVSCASASSCAAVGYYDEGLGTNAVPVATGWNGSLWSNQSMQSLASLGRGLVGGETGEVSCPVAGTCIAVGRMGDGTRTETLAEFGNGSSWTIQPTPDLAGASFANLADISCTSSTACMAVGAFWETNSGPARPLSERYSG